MKKGRQGKNTKEKKERKDYAVFWSSAQGLMAEN
jgi:hypothetical protein